MKRKFLAILLCISILAPTVLASCDSAAEAIDLGSVIPSGGGDISSKLDKANDKGLKDKIDDFLQKNDEDAKDTDKNTDKDDDSDDTPDTDDSAETEAPEELENGGAETDDGFGEIVGGDEHVHSWISVAAQKPTCTEHGWKAYTYCPECGEPEIEYIDATGHTEKVYKEAKAATCTEDGSTKGSYCKDCYEILSKEEVIPATGHVNLKKAVKENAVSASCTEDGGYDSVVYCECGMEHSRVHHTVAAKGHSIVTDAAVPATCTEDGLTEGSHCRNCDKMTVVQTVIPATGHSYVDGACVNCASGLKFTLYGSEYHVTGIDDGVDSDIRIPSTYKGLPVTAIENSAFMNNTSIKSVFIPDSITSIGNYAFSGCTSLTGISIPDSVESIGIRAFYGCEAMTDIEIGKGVTSIGDYAFYGCTLLERIYFNAASLTAPSTSCSVFDSSGQITKGIKVIIGSDVTQIPQYCFYGLKNLRYVEFEEKSVCTTIGMSAFMNCEMLVSVMLGESVSSIGSSAFMNCYRLVEIINYPKLNISVGSSNYGGIARYALDVHTGESTKVVQAGDYLFYALDGKNYLIGYVGTDLALTLPKDLNGEVYSINQYAFRGNASITSVDMSNGVTDIGTYAFYNCYNLVSITISSLATSIGNYAFSGCSRLTSVTIPVGVESLGASVFRGCTELEKVTILGNLKNIGNLCFQGCASLTEFSAHNEYYKSIDGNLYTADGSTLIQYAVGKTDTSFTLPAGVKTIAMYAFASCTALENVTLSYGLTTVGNYAFQSCTALKSINIPETVTSIGNNAFQSCSALESITIPDSVTSIGSGAFQKCISLAEATVSGTIGSSAFASCTALKTVTLKNTVTTIGNNAFMACSALESLTIPASVTSIGRYAFRNCKALTKVEFEITYEWQYSSSPSATAGGTVIEDSELRETENAAACLLSTYANFYWYRITE